jgi:hypothetical protein
VSLSHLCCHVLERLKLPLDLDLLVVQHGQLVGEALAQGLACSQGKYTTML